MDRKKVIKGLQNLRDDIATDFIHEADQAVGTIDDALAILKEQEEKKQKLLMNIADNQLAYAPEKWDDELDLKYKSGLWNGLQMAYEILNEGW